MVISFLGVAAVEPAQRNEGGSHVAEDAIHRQAGGVRPPFARDLIAAANGPAVPQSDSETRHPLTGGFLRGRLRHAMTPEEMDVVEGLIVETERLSGTHVVLRRGEVLHRSTILIEGYVLRVMEDDGKRHIVGINVPGDFIDLHGFALKRLDHDVMTVGSTVLGYAPHESIAQVLEDSPHLARIMWFSTLLEAAIHREWILALERLNSDGRLAHLISELWHRLNFVGLADTSGFGFPLTQADLADACGTTAIHMNRVVRQLRSLGLADLRRGRVSIPERAKLEAYARFNPDYLYGDGLLRVRDELTSDSG